MSNEPSALYNTFPRLLLLQRWSTLARALCVDYATQFVAVIVVVVKF